MQPDTEDFLKKALTRAARQRVAQGELHKAIAREHGQISKTLGALADSHSNSDPTLSARCTEMSQCHKRLAAHHTALSVPGNSTDIEKPGDDGDTDTATTKRLPSETYTYNVQGGGITERTRVIVRDVMGGDDLSIDPISKSAWGDDDDIGTLPIEDDDVLAKSTFSHLKKPS